MNKALGSLNHPALFILAIVIVVTAGQKAVAVLAGKAGLNEVANFFVPQHG